MDLRLLIMDLSADNSHFNRLLWATAMYAYLDDAIYNVGQVQMLNEVASEFNSYKVLVKSCCYSPTKCHSLQEYWEHESRYSLKRT